MTEQELELMVEQLSEDKFKNPTTTSNKFKIDLGKWLLGLPNSKKLKIVELGTHKGQTTHILSGIAYNGHVYTINLPNHFAEAQQINRLRTNISYVGLDLYPKNTINPIITTDSVDVFFIDAGHYFSQVESDFEYVMRFARSEPSYIVFDDYGLIHDVRSFVDAMIWLNRIEVVQYIGMPEGTDFGGNRLLKHHEGIICKII